MVYGSLFKPQLNGQDIDQSYHCWIEFYAPNLDWIPLDVAMADIHVGDFELNDANATLVERTALKYEGADLQKVEYYFGNLDERRVTWSRGRDLVLNPRQDGDPVNAIARAYVEIDGVPSPFVRTLTYRERGNER